MKKEELIHFIELMMSSDSYFKKLLILELFRKYLDVENSDIERIISDLELRRKIMLRDYMIQNEGFSYFIKEGKVENVYFPKYDELLERELLTIDTFLVELSVKFIKTVIEDGDVDFENA